VIWGVLAREKEDLKSSKVSTGQRGNTIMQSYAAGPKGKWPRKNSMARANKRYAFGGRSSSNEQGFAH
jgi:hypothetical protein